MNYINPNDYWNRKMRESMSEEERLKAAIIQCVSIIGLMVVGLLLCALLGSCTTTRVVTVERVKTDTVRMNTVQKDSVFLHDSIRVWQRGDTVTVDRWHTKYVERLKHDTTYISRTDSVPTPYPVIHEVEKKLSFIQKCLMGAGGAALMALVVFIGWRIKRWLPM